MKEAMKEINARIERLGFVFTVSSADIFVTRSHFLEEYAEG